MTVTNNACQIVASLFAAKGNRFFASTEYRQPASWPRLLIMSLKAVSIRDRLRPLTGVLQ